MLLARRWWALLAGALLGLVLGSAYLASAEYEYTAEMRVSSVQSQGNSMARRLSGLAAAAGVDIAKRDSASPFDLYLEAIYSSEVAQAMAQRPWVLRGAFDKEWAAGRWREPQTTLGEMAKRLKRTLGIPVFPWQAPNPDRLADWIEKNVVIAKNNQDALVSVQLESADPRFAGAFLETLHGVTDEIIRRKSVARTDGTIAYLERKLREVLLVEHRQALASALGEQERTRMMASVDVSFSADRFGAVKLSTTPTSPRPAVVLALGLIAGLTLGGMVAIGWHVLARGRRLREPRD